MGWGPYLSLPTISSVHFGPDISIRWDNLVPTLCKWIEYINPCRNSCSEDDDDCNGNDGNDKTNDTSFLNIDIPVRKSMMYVTITYSINEEKEEGGSNKSCLWSHRFSYDGDMLSSSSFEQESHSHHCPSAASASLPGISKYISKQLFNGLHLVLAFKNNNDELFGVWFSTPFPKDTQQRLDIQLHLRNPIQPSNVYHNQKQKQNNEIIQKDITGWSLWSSSHGLHKIDMPYHFEFDAITKLSITDQKEYFNNNYWKKRMIRRLQVEKKQAELLMQTWQEMYQVPGERICQSVSIAFANHENALIQLKRNKSKFE